MDELKEKIARAIDDATLIPMGHGWPKRFSGFSHERFAKAAQAALTSIEEAGYVVVPKEPVAWMIMWSDGEVSFSRSRTKSTEDVTVKPVYAAAIPTTKTDLDLPRSKSYATLSDSATTFDPEKQFEKDNGV